MPTDAISRIKALYYGATEKTIAADLQEAIALLKTLETEEERERAAVFMDGLAQMRSEWALERARGHGGRMEMPSAPRPAPTVRPKRDRRSPS
ncbi:MAG: hypothetical protein KJ061_09805 [Vicinamibacteraceae bacterium]|nr:hypothetical protein [Vicinamibacteraceae bacterium]